MNLIRRFAAEEDGNDATEYALILVGVAIAIAAAVTQLGGNLVATLKDACGKIATAGGPGCA